MENKTNEKKWIWRNHSPNCKQKETASHVSFKAALGDRKESFRNPQSNGITSQAGGSPSSTTAKQGNGHQKYLHYMLPSESKNRTMIERKKMNRKSTHSILVWYILPNSKSWLSFPQSLDVNIAAFLERLDQMQNRKQTKPSTLKKKNPNIWEK